MLGRVRTTVTPRTVDLACLGVVTVWGLNSVVMKRALERFDLPTFNVIRFTGMVVIGWALMVFNHRRRGHAYLPEAADRRRLAFAGGVGFFGYLYGFTIGLKYTSAFSSSLLTGMSSLFVALLLWVTRVEALSRRHVIALVSAFVGAVVFVIGRGNGQIEFKGGDVVALGAAFLYAAYLVINRPLTTKYPAASLTTWSMSVAYVVVLAVGGPFVKNQDWGALDTGAWLAMVWAITLPVFIAWTVWAWANGRVGVARPALYLVFVPVVSGVAAWWALDEEVHVLQIVGLVLVVGALLLGRQGSRGRRPSGVALAADS